MRRARRGSIGRTSRSINRSVRRRRRRTIRRSVLVGGMVVIAAQGASAAIKLSQQDAQRIQQHTGMAPQELEDNDLAQAMQELNIKSAPLNAEDLAATNQEGLVNNQAPQAVQPAERPTPEQDVITQIERFADLHDRGILTEEEFEAKKRQLLGL
jgi:hypothetical protein